MKKNEDMEHMQDSKKLVIYLAPLSRGKVADNLLAHSHIPFSHGEYYTMKKSCYVFITLFVPLSRKRLTNRLTYHIGCSLIFLRSVSIFLMSHILSFPSYEYFNF